MRSKTIPEIQGGFLSIKILLINIFLEMLYINAIFLFFIFAGGVLPAFSPSSSSFRREKKRCS